LDQHELTILFNELHEFITSKRKPQSIQEIAFMEGFLDGSFGVDLVDSYKQFISERIFCYNVEIHAFLMGYSNGQVNFQENGNKKDI
jgi:hypothetical protein